MWIKLISPRVTLRPVDTALKRQMAPPLSLLVLGALTPRRHRVTVTDENVEKLTLADTPDLIGITVKADTAERAWAIARSYRDRGIPVVLGGIHPTACPQDNAPHADAIVVGEAEDLWSRVLQDTEAGVMRDIYQAEHPPDLARTPLPRWELIRDKDYLYTNTLTIGRGCPWGCSFCYSSSPNIPTGYRMKPVANVLREIESLSTRHVMFIDDNFIADPTRARRLLAALKPLGLTWHTAVSADIGRHGGILDLMAESGCRSLYIGFETLSAENLRGSRKRQNQVEEYGRTIVKIHARGIMVNASLVFGFDHDGPEVFDTTQQWLAEQKVETMTGHILTPYPGTALYARLSAEGRIIDHDLTHYNTSRAVFRPAQMSAAELEAGYLRMYRQFYSWRSILRRRPADPRRRKAYLMFNLFYRKFGRAVALGARLGLLRAAGRLGARCSYPELAARSAKVEPDGPPLDLSRALGPSSDSEGRAVL